MFEVLFIFVANQLATTLNDTAWISEIKKCMDRKDEVTKRSHAISLLARAKEMEILMKKIPVRIDKNTVLLVTAEKLQRMGLSLRRGKRSRKK